MKKVFKLVLLTFSAIAVLNLTGCSDKDDVHKDYASVIVGFANVSSDLIGGPTEFGANLYLGSNYEIEKGYITLLYGDTYAQFPINYGYGYSADFLNSGWGYSFTNGGMALSNWHNMTINSYTNQLSVYSNTSPSGGNFVVANGFADVTDPSKAKYSDYDGCAHVYITDSEGFGVTNIGEEGQVSGVEEDAFFKSVYINNTTYTFLVMKDGNGFGGAPLEDQKGWFKVQFIAFDDAEPDEKPAGYVEAYLANFDESLNIGYTGIIDEWIKVDLSSLPECSVLVINFVGSDAGEFGLNTPGYCALDNFEISVEK